MAKDILPEHLKILVVVSRALVTCFDSGGPDRKVTDELTTQCVPLPGLDDGLDYGDFLNAFRVQKAGLRVQAMGRAFKSDFARALQNRQLDVVVFDGYADAQANLHFEGPHGQSHLIAAGDLARQFHPCGVKLLVLTNCHSPNECAQTLARAGVRTVLVLPASVGHDTKRIFMEELARLLPAEQTIEEIVLAAREAAAKRLEGQPDALAGLRFEGSKKWRRANFCEEVSAKDSIYQGFIAHRHNLPEPTKGERFIGRNLELTNLARILDTTQILVLNGASGMGKSSLVHRLAKRLIERGRFLGAVSFNAGQESSLSAMFCAVARVMGLPIGSEEELNARVRDFLVKNRLLVIVDECDALIRAQKRPPVGEEFTGVVSAAAELLEYLKTFRGLSKFVVIKRTGRLGNPNEKCFGIMGLPAANAPELVESIMRERNPAVELTDTTRQSIGRLCELLNSSPLSLQIATHYMVKNEWSPSQMVSAVRDYLQSHQGTTGDDFVSIVFDWLTGPAQKLLVCLSIYAGRPDGNAVAAVANQEAPGWERGPFRELSGTGLIQQDASTKMPRCYMPPAVRDVGLQRLKEPKFGVSPTRIFKHHCAYYLKVAAQFVTTPPEQWRSIEIDWPDILLGALWSARNCIGSLRRIPTHPDELETLMNSGAIDPDIFNSIIRYAAALRQYLLRCHPGPCAREILLAGLAAADALSEPKMLGVFCNDIGLTLGSQGKYKEALLWFNKSAEIREDLEDRAGLASVYTNVANVLFKIGDFEESLTWYHRDREITESLNDRHGLVTTYANIALVHKALGQLDQTLFWYGKALWAQEYLGDEAGEARTCDTIGDVHCARGAPDQALPWYKKAAAFYHKLEDRPNLASAKTEIAKLLEFSGQFDEALKEYNGAFAIYRAAGDKLKIGELLFLIGKHYWVRRHFDEAIQWLTNARRTFHDIGDEADVAKVCYHLGLAERDRKQPTAAVQAFRDAIESYERKDDKNSMAIALNCLGEIYLEARKHAEAKKEFEAALGMISASAEKHLASNLYARVGEAAYALKQDADAYQALTKSLDLKLDLKDEQGQADVLQQMGVVAVTMDNARQGLAHLEAARELFTKLGVREKVSEIDGALRKARKLARRSAENNPVVDPDPKGTQ